MVIADNNYYSNLANVEIYTETGEIQHMWLL